MYVDTLCPTDVRPVRLQRAEGRASIGFRLKAGTTRLKRLFQEGCAKVRLPKPLTGPAPEAVLINTAGGLTGGDRFAAEVDLAEGASAVITTQACERIYRSTGEAAAVSSRLTVAAGANLAWLPQETILFDRAKLSRRLEADLEGDARLLAVEAVLFGRTAMGEVVRHGTLRDRWRIRRDGRLIFADDLRLEGEVAERLLRPAVLGGHVAMATVLLADIEAGRFLDPVRAAIGEDGGVSAWQDKLVIRLCADSGLHLRRRLEPVLSILLDGQELPKVWQL
jgi:urease accessory protein